MAGKQSAPMPMDADDTSFGEYSKTKTTSQDAVTALLQVAAVDTVGDMQDVTSPPQMASNEAASEKPKDEEPLISNGLESVVQPNVENGTATSRMTMATDDPRDEKPEQHYSTRGRDRHSKEEDVKVAQEEPLEKEINSSSAAATSFLEDLTGHERLTRTRFLPDVDGIHVLRKFEVRSDLALARSIVSSLGLAGQVPSKRSRKNRSGTTQGSEDPLDGNEEAGGEGPSGDDLEEMSGNSVRLEPHASATCRAFIAPLDANGGDDMDGKKGQPTRPPHVVEAVVAYNPPRPPESVGPKKKHRMLRWERKPQDIEVDLSNYRKTVQRTREELHNAEEERQRIESIGFTLANNYLAQLRALNQEGRELNDEFARVQLNCVKTADLLTSRTRSRGGGKTNVIKDVLSILKARGTELADCGIALGTTLPTGKVKIPKGMGGVSAQSFSDWTQSTEFTPVEIASAWILPGDKVETPYGEGVVLHVYGPCNLDVTAPPLSGAALKPSIPAFTKPFTPRQASVGESKPDASHGFGASAPVLSADGKSVQAILGEDPVDEDGANPAEMSMEGAKKASSKHNGEKALASQYELGKTFQATENLLSPRLCVKLPFGIGFFPVSVVASKEDPTSYSDTKLAARWKVMIETALPLGTYLDLAVMETIGFANEGDKANKVTDDDGMDAEDETEGSQSGDAAAVTDSSENGGGCPTDPAGSKRFVPFASALLPTSLGRGGLVAEADLPALESAMKKPVFDGGGVLGSQDNKGLPKGFREWEDSKCELTVMRATVLQRKNELLRQKRIRQLNERAMATTNDRSFRVEALVLEMRTDLKSLKDRLGDELVELQLSSELSEGLLSQFYLAQDQPKFSITDATPPKRRRAGKDGSDSVSPARRVPVDAEETEGAMDVNTDDDDDEQLEAVPVGTSLIQSLDDDDRDRPHKRSRPSAQ